MASFRRNPSSGSLRSLIGRKRTTARAVMAMERLWLLVLPALCILALFVSLSWFGYFRAVPDWLRIVSLVMLAGAFAGSVFLLRWLRLPRPVEIDRRLEEQNAIVHQAIRAQDDRLESDTPMAQALWSEHQRRMAAGISALQVGLPNPDTPRRDPFGFRALVVLLLVTAFAYSYSNQSGRLTDAFVSHAGADGRAATRIDAWVTPPPYTNRAPIFLTAGDAQFSGPIDIPAASRIVVRVTGGSGGETVSFAPDGREAAPVALAEAPATIEGAPAPTPATGTARSYEMEAAQGGRLSIEGGAAPEDTGWAFRVVADTPPGIAFAGEPRRAVNGALEIDFTVRDDYGVQEALAEIEPLEPPAANARPLFDAPEYRLTIPRQDQRIAEGNASHDLTEHPLAGAPVRVTLVATDAAGQEGRSETREMILPSRGFSEPLARAIVEQRRILALDANAVPRVLELMDALTIAPEETIEDLAHYLLIVSARTRITQAYNDDMLRDAADYMWEIALGIEDGDLSLAERRLRDAQRNLAEALENGASDEEIQALMDELREAMQEFMQALAQELQNSEQAQQLPEGALENLLRQEDLENMLDQIENLARQGARDEAQQLLSELQRMMNNLQAGRQQQPGDSQMRQQMDKLGDLMQQQQQLMDETFQLDQALRDRMQRQLPEFGQPQPAPGQPQQGQPQPGQPQQGRQGQQGEGSEGLEGMTAEELEEALKQLRAHQEALQEQLGELQEQLEALGIQPGEGFGEAGEAMGDAAGSLGAGRGEQAVGEQGRALEALRQGAQDMMNQMMQAMGQGQGQDEGQGQTPGRMGSSDRDPLGRPRSTEGPDFGDSVRVPDEIDIQRAREILEAIRERLGNALSPDMEKRYLERLLDMQ